MSLYIDRPTKAKIEIAHPKLRDELEEIIEKINKEVLTGNAKVRITHTLRTFEEQAELYAQGRTKPGKRVTNAKPGFSFHNYGLACFDIETKIFTNQGIKYFYELDGTEEVLTFKDGVLEYQKPIAYISNNYDGEMVRIKSRSVDLLVTPNHKMITKRKTNGVWSEQWGETLAENLDYKYKIPTCGVTKHTARLSPKIMYYKTELEIENIEDWYEFLGYYISEGYCIGTKSEKKLTGGSRNNVCISQCKKANPQVWEKIKNCLDRLNFKYHYIGHDFVISNKSLHSILFPLGNSYKKHIPKYYLSSDRALLEKLYYALIDGDGTYYDNGEAYFTVSEQLKDDFKQLAILLGKSCYSYSKIAKQNHIMPHGLPLKTFNEQYTVRTRTSTEHELRNGSDSNRCIKREYYKGLVYCVTTEAGAIVVERNNKVSISGNCDVVLIVNGVTASWDTKKDFDKDNQADWMEVVKVFKEYGWVWGGDWRSFRDLPHFEKTFGNSISSLKRKHENKQFIVGTEYVRV